MKRTRSTLSTFVASSLVFGSLGMSGFVGSVASMADDRGAPVRKNPAKPVRVENAIDTSTNGHATRANAVSSSTRLAKSQLLGAHLSRDGMLTGRLNVSDSISGAHVSAENLLVKFVRRGSVVAEAKPGPGGVFQVEGLTPGVFSMVAAGADGYFASTVVVYPFEQDEDVATGKAVVDPLQIDATVVHPSNIAIVNKLIQKSWPHPEKSSSPKKQVVQASHLEEDADQTPAPLQTPVLTIGNDGRVVIAVDDINPATGERTPAKSATAYLIQRGAVRGQFQIDQDGTFNAKDLKPGQYSLLVMTQSEGSVPNIAALGVIVERDSGNSGTVSNSSRLAVQQVKAKKQQPAPTITPAPGGDISSTADPAPPGNDQMAGGGMFGGGGGGIGGGGGGGLGLGLLGLAGLAGLAGLRNNNNNNSAASPATP